MSNRIRSLIQNNKWTVGIISTAVLIPTVTALTRQSDSTLETKNDGSNITKKKDDDKKQNILTKLKGSLKHNKPDKIKESPNTSGSNDTNNTIYDVGKDWVHETPLNFLNSLILNKNSERNDDTDANKEQQTQEEEEENIFKKLMYSKNKDSSTTDDINNGNNGDNKHTQDEDDDDNNPFTFSSMTNTFSELISGEISDKTFQELINHAAIHSSNRSQKNGGEESRALRDVIDMLMIDLEKVKQSLIRNFEDLGHFYIDPTSIFYYLEYEDEKKNPSWKRRVHRFCRGVDLNEVNYLNESLKLAELSYADTIDEIKDGLKNGTMVIGDNDKERYELIYCQMESFPGKPSHYLAVKRGQSIWSNNLEVLMVIRGTKTVPDMLTDALLDATNYKGGKAHAGIMTSGKYLVDKHSKMMESLLQFSKKKKIKLSIIGHSLGAGTATIAGMEFNDNPMYDVSVVGFGCPALLSKDLSESTSSYVTTVIGDSDIVPRMSAATIGNVVLDVAEYDWTSKARRDVQQILHELILNKTPFLSEEIIQSIMNSIDDKIIDKIREYRIKDKTTKRMDPILYPPGKCIHFYRDGVAVSGALTPATFFNEIDISRTMIEDHIISGYRGIFLDVMRNYHNDDHFSFEKKGTTQ